MLLLREDARNPYNGIGARRSSMSMSTSVEEKVLLKLTIRRIGVLQLVLLHANHVL